MAIDLDNPLLAYRAWFIEQEAGWADTIVNSFENFSGMLSVSKEIVAGSISVEQFEEHCQKQEDAERDKYDEEFSDYEDGDDAKVFVDYLDKIIELNDPILIEPVALALLIATDSFAFALYEENRPFDLLASNQEALFKSLLEGDMEKANDCENNIREETRHRRETKILTESWEELSKSKFNLKVIKTYTIRTILGL